MFLSDVLKCREAMIDFVMILGDFGVFSLMLTDIRTYGRTYGRTDGWTDRPSYRDARAHLKTFGTLTAAVINCCKKQQLDSLSNPNNNNNKIKFDVNHDIFFYS